MLRLLSIWVRALRRAGLSPGGGWRGHCSNFVADEFDGIEERLLDLARGSSDCTSSPAWRVQAATNCLHVYCLCDDKAEVVGKAVVPSSLSTLPS
jgi:hypothetical protein